LRGRGGGAAASYGVNEVAIVTSACAPAAVDEGVSAKPVTSNSAALAGAAASIAIVAVSNAARSMAAHDAERRLELRR
jgi:hypothetical protein